MSTPVVSGVDTSPVLETSEHILDLVALAIENRIVAVLDAVLGMGWDAGSDAPFGQRLPQADGTVGTVGEQEARGRQSVEDCGGGLMIVGLAFGQVKQQGPSFAVADHLQLGGQATPATSDASG